MYPHHHHPQENVPLQVGGNEVLPERQGDPVLVQHTAVNMRPEPPRDHIIWSLCCFFYSHSFCCCCLGLGALIFSIKARDRKVVGDLEGARHYGKTAAAINLVSTILMSILTLGSIIAIIVVCVLISKAAQARFTYRPTYPEWNHYG